MSGVEYWLRHTSEDEQLYQNLQVVLNAPQQLISHLVGSRSKHDRNELARIIQHLPVVRDHQAGRGVGAPPGGLSGGCHSSPKRDRGEAAVAMPAIAEISGLGSNSLEIMASPGRQKKTPGSGTPRSARSQLNTPRLSSTGSAIIGGNAAETPWSPQRDIKKDVPGDNANNKEAASRSALLARKASADAIMHAQRQEALKKAQALEKESVEQVTSRCTEQLAHLGIDPQGMSATDILRIYYARGCGSTYTGQNKSAEQRLNHRQPTPQSFSGVFKERALREVSRARNLPPTDVHNFLDQWEVAFLGDICRSVRRFDQESRGCQSTYRNAYKQDSQVYTESSSRRINDLLAAKAEWGSAYVE